MQTAVVLMAKQYKFVSKCFYDHLHVLCLTKCILAIKAKEILTGVGFEPTHPKILRPERSALDRSAIVPS